MRHSGKPDFTPGSRGPRRSLAVVGAGALVQAEILSRAGYDAWSWEDQALLRAYVWLHEQADFPAEGDDRWQPHLINLRYGTDFPAETPAQVGKNMGWTDWSHAE